MLVNLDYSSLVERAQKGDIGAFSELVTHFQDMAVGSAYGWLGDIELAREVSQEAFLEAHLNLHLLRSSAAFPGWFKKIVVKQCDRVTRRKSLRPSSMDAAQSIASDTSSPESSVQLNQLQNNIRLAVEALSEEQRLVVSLHYFAEMKDNAIAEFLDLPLSTVKKRLRAARKRILGEGDQLMRETINNIRPSVNRTFSEEVSFFIALRQGDLTEVKHLVSITPQLVNAKQTWNPELVREGILPFANNATALITAVELNNFDMQVLLVNAGADVNDNCGCATGESAIWAATLLNRPRHARHLLANGANPNVYSVSGNTPLHVAAMRGLTELAYLLLEYGADMEARDQQNKTPVPLTPTRVRRHQNRTPFEWALANGHLEVAEILRPKSNTTSTEVKLEEKHPALSNSIILHTGIRAIDFFSPLRRGGLIRVPFKAGVGMLVMLGELSHRFYSQHDGATVWTGFTHPPFDISDWEAEVSEFGLKQHIQHSLVSFKEDASDRRAGFHRGILMAESLRDSGQHVLAIVQSTEGFEHDIEENLHRLSQSSEKGSITTIVITPWEKQAWPGLKAPYSAQITLDRQRALRNLFPAIDPELSFSNALCEKRHELLRKSVAMLLTWYQTVDPDFNLSDLEYPDQARIEKARAVLTYFCQPFVITEPFSGTPGEQTGLEKVLDDIELILND
ncbi:MAG: sigma-70 family RNA polymerase sigma factor [bacterium]|nr:sigma-70 family RNA polymerase sigma factor [Gammaproteobacteria bacterium]